MEFSKQDYWSGLPFSSLRDLPDPGIKPRYPTLQVEALPLSHQGDGEESGLMIYHHLWKEKDNKLPTNL